jgi:tripartite-type tricarboxylate transporter receptor subunit TctC
MMKKLLAALVLGAAAMAASAQSWPTKPIRLVVPFPPGSATDTIARAFGGAVAQSLGQPVLVENKAGADGAISGAEVMRAPSDGYTLFFATNSPMAVAPAMRKNPPYDPIRDFTPIADIGRYTFFVVVHPSVPAKTVAELLQHAKDNPGKLNYATGNTTGIMSTAQFMHLGGVKMVHVPYKGEPQALIDLIAGRVQFMVVSAGTSVPHIREGKLRAIAVITTKRSPILPDVPTIAEAGMPAFSITSWAALYGPAKMPREIVDRLNREFLAAAQRPEVQATLEKQAFMFVGSTPERLAAFTKEQNDEYRAMMRATGMEPD